jgi:murein DD-endopeptidase MepM/ murein hydrolase activator NlpD
LGNFVLIDHQNGEFIILPHMRIGTVHVKAGDRVHRGDVLGEVGFSGDAIFPHVRFALLSGPDIHSNEGVPCYFDHLTRLFGDKRIRVDRSSLDTGDIVEDANRRFTRQRPPFFAVLRRSDVPERRSFALVCQKLSAFLDIGLTQT